MPLRTYKDWEYGVTKDIKTPYLLRAVRFLRGSLEQLAEIPDSASTEDGEQLAERWISRETVVAALAPTDATPEEQRRLNRLIELLAEGVSPEEAARRVLRGE